MLGIQGYNRLHVFRVRSRLTRFLFTTFHEEVQGGILSLKVVVLGGNGIDRVELKNIWKEH